LLVRVSYRSGFDKDALAGAFLGRFNHCIKHVVGEVCQAFSTLWVAFGSCKNFVALLDVCETIVKKSENIRCDFFAQSVASA
jgi:hypothetical protein